MTTECGRGQGTDEIYHRYKFTPAKVEVEEHHVAVYTGKKDDTIVRAEHPGYLLRGSLVSPSMEAAIINTKYVNAYPLYRQVQRVTCGYTGPTACTAEGRLSCMNTKKRATPAIQGNSWEDSAAYALQTDTRSTIRLKMSGKTLQ